MRSHVRKLESYHFRLFGITFIILTVIYCIISKYRTQKEENVTVRIELTNAQQRYRLQRYLSKSIHPYNKSYIEASVNWKQFFFLQKEGLNPALQVTMRRDELLDPYFHTLAEVDDFIKYYATEYPNVVHLEQIGMSSNKNFPIWGVKISDNPTLNEAEPAVLFSAAHHAKELLGVEVCLYLLDYFCKNYPVDSKVQNWVDKTEIWIIPVINPDGYFMVMDSKTPLQFWRKNLRDNNCNGIFNSDYDGVDLNRNYDFNWDVDSNGNPKSWYYRGPYPFSEKETQAIRDITFRERFVFNLDFHSFGEIVLYPWENFSHPPDLTLVIEIAQEIAKQIQKRAGLENYSIRPLNGNLGQCSVWMHGSAGVLSYIIEVGDSHFPKGHEIPKIIKQNANAAFYVLDRLFVSAVQGIIKNAYNKTPISAEVEIIEYNSDIVSNPISDPSTGYFHRILTPGLYSIKFAAPGFRTKVIHAVKVEANSMTTLDIDLYPIEDILPTEN